MSLLSPVLVPENKNRACGLLIRTTNAFPSMAFGHQVGLSFPRQDIWLLETAVLPITVCYGLKQRTLLHLDSGQPLWHLRSPNVLKPRTLD
jgi:hypothetical protein